MTYRQLLSGFLDLVHLDIGEALDLQKSLSGASQQGLRIIISNTRLEDAAVTYSNSVDVVGLELGDIGGTYS
jgi:hypothetical protein